MRLLEELQMNAYPSLQTMLYDGWVLRFADGYTNRANSINPIYQSLENIDEKIDKCEIIFRKENLKPMYRITPFVYPSNLDELLENRGYEKIRQTSIRTLDLSSIMEPTINSIITSSEPDHLWFDNYCEFNNVNERNRSNYKKMLGNLIPDKFFTSLLVNNEVIACGMGVIENGFMALFSITVSEQYRNNGYGTQLLINMLKEGKASGAKTAYLQVMLDNIPALQLYNRLGFKEEYKYHYRVL